jgi:hypothetical protein
MSCPAIRLYPSSTCQGTFDHIVAKGTGLAESAPVGNKLAALRSLSTKELVTLQQSTPARSAWDEAFFPDLPKTTSSIDTVSNFPSRVKMVVVRQTKDENALFAQRWATITGEDLLHERQTAFLDPLYGQEILKAYDVTSHSSHSERVAALTAYTTDCFFSKATYSTCISVFLQSNRPSFSRSRLQRPSIPLIGQSLSLLSPPGSLLISASGLPGNSKGLFESLCGYGKWGRAVGGVWRGEENSGV